MAEVTREKLPVAWAAGAGEGGGLSGTSAAEIAAAIGSVHGPDGVLVLMDIGSSILSAETALELLPAELRQGVELCPAPLVEGAIAAAVQIGAGQDLRTVRREAQRGLEPKQHHLGGADEELSGASAAPARGLPAEAPPAQAILSVENEHGLHARPAARLARLAASFDARVTAAREDRPGAEVDATSLNALTTLGILKGDRLIARARGPQAGDALEALRLLARSRFDEAPEGPPELHGPRRPAPPGSLARPASGAAELRHEEASACLTGIPVCPGIALGPLMTVRRADPVVPRQPDGEPQAEWASLCRSLEAARQRLARLREGLQQRVGEAQLGIFDACALTLEDPVLLARVRARVFEEKLSAGAAWQEAIRELLAAYRSLADPYLRQRAIDVEEIGGLVLELHVGLGEGPDLSAGQADRDDRDDLADQDDRAGILAVRELAPGLVGRLDPTRVAALAAVFGGPTSHGAVLARALGIPTVGGIDAGILSLPAGTPLAVDGQAGLVWVEPSAETAKDLSRRRTSWLRERTRLRRRAQRPAVTRDGVVVAVQANTARPADGLLAAERGAEGIGVLRTEFLYLGRHEAPSEDEQAETLMRIGEAFPGRPVRVRTLDIGGDKSLPYLRLPPEANPYLGIRSIRHSLRNPELFVPQLRAILRAGAKLDIQVLFPMVATLEELGQALRLLEEAHRGLEASRLPHRWPVPTGIMVETPSAALIAECFAPSVKFFSIGTNDLTQYTLAAERGNPELASYADGLHPAVLKQVREVARVGRRRGRSVSVCGELAGDPAAIPILLGLGVDCLSVNPEQLPATKERIRQVDLAAARELAAQALTMRSAGEVRERCAAARPRRSSPRDRA